MELFQPVDMHGTFFFGGTPLRLRFLSWRSDYLSRSHASSVSSFRAMRKQSSS
jgi:hypothetical protein